jgi:hypothetical protein
MSKALERAGVASLTNATPLTATPAIADDTLYIRTAGHLYAFAEN